jgi:hypothetical protein
MTTAIQSISPRPALVSRPPERADDPDRYLVLTPQGAAAWTSDPAAATPFESMREATRAAARLPSPLRAFGLPLRSELAVAHLLH